MALSKNAKLNVLLIEDNVAHAELIQRYAKRSRVWQVTEVARSIQGAIEKIENHTFDVALLDLHLPDSQGLHSLKELMQVADDFPWIVLTSFDNKPLALEALSLGAEDYLVKINTDAVSLERSILYAKERFETAKHHPSGSRKHERFIHTLSHDLKAPIRYLRFFSEILQDAIQKRDFQECAETAERIHEASTKLTSLLDAITKFSIASKPNVHLQEVSLQSLVQQLRLFLGPMIREKDANIHIVADASFQMDPVLAYLLFQNLIQNALKYRRKEVRPQILLSVQNQDQSWRIEVEDNGIGIAQEHLSEIFEPMRQLHASDKSEGFGFGLSLCKQIVETHQGQIGVHSELGKGSIFYVVLPKQLVQ